MYCDFKEHLAGVSQIESLLAIVAVKLADLRHKGAKTVGYISGLAGASLQNGNVREGLARLDFYGAHIGKTHFFPVFSVASMFDADIYERVGGDSIDTFRWLSFSNKLLETNNITLLIMLPGWRDTLQAKDEMRYAMKHRIKVMEFDADLDGLAYI